MAKQPKSVEEQIRDAAKKAGLTTDDFHPDGAISTKAIGDGTLLKKFQQFLKFLELIGPILAPIIGGAAGGVTGKQPEDQGQV